MLSKPLKLDSLPVEIIRRIAAFGPCESALALLKVNRVLYQACNDRLVFKSIIDNGNGPSREMPVWQCTALSLQSPISYWARYALADSKLAHMPWHIIRDGVDIVDKLVTTGAPQLMASHRKLAPIF